MMKSDSALFHYGKIIQDQKEIRILQKLKKLGIAFILFCSSVLVLSTQEVQAKEYSDHQLRQYAIKMMKKNHLRGTIEIVKDGHAQAVSLGYGYYGRKIKNGNKRLVYPLGSLQKVITSAIITQLIYQHKLSQNTKISRWYPHLRNAKQISVGQFMTHTSGINVAGTEVNHHINFSENGAVNWTIIQADLQRRTARNKFNYNNANYILLAGIIRKVTGKSYAANVKSRIVKPLGLKHTYIYQQIPRSKTDAILYLYYSGKNYRSSSYANRDVVSQLPGAGNLFSTASDYLKIQRGLINGKILNEKQFNYLTHLDSKVNTYSGGVYLKNDQTLKLAYGNFGDTHFVNWMQLTTNNQNGIVMVLNQTHGSKNHIRAVGYQILKQIKTGTFIRG